MDIIHKNGYLKVEKAFNQKELDYGLLAIAENESGVNYTMMKDFIDQVFMPKVSRTLRWGCPVYTKFRFSDSQNATDASTYHGDIYNYTDMELLPIYTCLCYFDGASTEVIPGSHKTIAAKQKEGLSTTCYGQYDHRKALITNPGDMLVFHANMHHRGLFYKSNGHRRLLQVFEVFPTREIFNTHIDRLLCVTSYQSGLLKFTNSVSQAIAKTDYIINTITYIHYYLMYHDYQYRITGSDITDSEKHNRYVTYEPGERAVIIPNTFQKWNVNIIVTDHNTIMPRKNYILILVMIILILAIGYAIIRKKSVGGTRGNSKRK